METGRTASGVPLLPRVAVPLVDTQAVRDLLSTISGAGYNAQLAAAVQLAGLLEVEEGRFRDVVGDPWGGPAGQRATHSIGKLLACIKDRESVYDTVCESWLLARSAPLEQQVAGLRLVLACVSCWGFQYPLTEDRCMEQLLEWAGDAGDNTPTPADPLPADDEALLREARSVYATGLLSVAMSNEDYSGQASSTPLVPRVAKYLRTALLDQQAPPPAAPPAPPPPPPAADGPVAAASARALCHHPQALRRLRLQYCAALLGEVGEYLDALGPVLAERGAESLLELMRRYAAVDHRMLYDALGACVALTAHRRFSEQFVEAGGVELALALPRNPHTYSGLAMLLYSLAAAPLAFERLLALGPGQAAGPGGGPQRGGGGPGAVIAAALSLMSCGQDSARKTAVTFLSSCMHFPATLREFQAQDGVRRMLNLLRALLTGLRGASPPDLRLERQVGYYAALTLRMFVAAHLVLHVGALRRGLANAASAAANGPNRIAAPPAGPNGTSAAGAGDTPLPAKQPDGAAAQSQAAVVPYRPVDTSREALDALAASLESDRRLAEAFARCRWPALEHLLDAGAPALLLELVSALPPERWFHEAAQAALEAVRLLSLAPLARRAVVAAVVPVGGGAGGGQRSGVGVLLNAASLSTSTFFASDPEMVAEALSTITNCVTAPPSLAPLLPSGAALARAATAAGGGGGGGGGGGVGALHGATPARRPDRHLPWGPDQAGGGGLQAEPAALAEVQPAGAQEDDGGAAGGGAASNEPPPLPLDLGPAAPTLGQALEAGYVLARQVVRQANGIRSLIQLLQPRHGHGPNAVPPAALDRIQALACRALVGLAGDPSIRQILTRLQLARLMSDLVREPVGAARRPAGVPLEPGVPYQRGVGVDWHAAFTGVALDLIALTTTGTGPVGPRHTDKFTHDATAPALHKIERAAIAAASHVSYSPQELLLLVYEHLMASGLHSAAAALATEANLARASTALHKLLHLQAGGAAAGTAAATAPPPLPLPPPHVNAAAVADFGQQPPPPHPHPQLPEVMSTQQGGLLGTAGGTPYTGVGTCRKGRAIAISAALRDAAAGRSRSDLALDLSRIVHHHHQPQQQQQQPQVTVSQAVAEATPVAEAGRLGVLKRRASMPLPPPAHPLTRSAAATAAAAPAVGAAAAAEGVVSPASVSTVAPPGDARSDGKSSAATVAAARGGGGQAAGATAAAAAPNGRLSSVQGRGGRRRGGANGQAAAASKAAQPTAGVAELETAQGALAAAAQPAVAIGDAGAEGRQAAEAGGAAAEPTDANYLLRAFGQQHHHNHHRMSGLAATPQLQGRSKAMASPFAATTTDRPLRPGAAAVAVSTLPASNAAGGPHARNPLIADLPARKPAASAATALKRHSSNSTAAAVSAVATPAAANAAGAPAVPAGAVPELPGHVEAAARDLHLLSRPPALSKLHHIVMSYLRQQHRQAVMQSAVPTAMLPPIPLSRPYIMPQATHALDAPACVTRRVARRELLGDHGGRGGARADSQLIYSRFRPLRTFRDDGSLSLCAAFMQGWRSLVVGTHGGELKLQDPLEGEILDVVEGHSSAVTQLRVHDSPGQPLLLSSSRSDVKLWAGGTDAELLPRGPRATWDGVTWARFHPAGSQVVAVSSILPRQAMIYDIRTATKLAVLDPPPLASAAGGPSPGGGGSRTPGGLAAGAAAGVLHGGDVRRPGRGGTAQTAAACYSPTGEMLLWGNCLYDLRYRSAVHQFDQFTDIGSGAFHPAGLEVILNSEVWDLRTFKLLRSVPALDGAAVRFNGRGDVLYAARRQSDEPLSQLFHPRRARHPLHMAFRTLDAATYADIATVAVERVVLDLAVEPTDSLVAVVAVDLSEEELTSAARVYEVGRRRPADDESDAEDDEDDDDSDGGSEDEDEEVDFDGSDFDTPAPARGRQNRRPGGGGAGAAARRRLASEILAGGEDGGEDEDGLGGLLDAGGGAGEGEDEDVDDGAGGTDDEEMGMAMLEDAYAALEDVYGGEEEDLDEMDEQDDEDESEEDGEGEYAELDAFLEGQEDEEEDEDEDDSSEGSGS